MACGVCVCWSGASGARRRAEKGASAFPRGGPTVFFPPVFAPRCSVGNAVGVHLRKLKLTVKKKKEYSLQISLSPPTLPAVSHPHFSRPSKFFVKYMKIYSSRSSFSPLSLSPSPVPPVGEQAAGRGRDRCRRLLLPRLLGRLPDGSRRGATRPRYNSATSARHIPALTPCSTRGSASHQACRRRHSRPVAAAVVSTCSR